MKDGCSEEGAGGTRTETVTVPLSSSSGSMSMARNNNTGWTAHKVEGQGGGEKFGNNRGHAGVENSG